MKLNKENKLLIDAQMKLMNTRDINVIITNFIDQELIYQKRIELLTGALEKYKTALGLIDKSSR